MRRLQLSQQWIAELRRPQIAALRGLVLHGLRATAVVRLRRAGVSAPLISDMVGMSEPMVARYCRFSDQKDNALAAVHILDRTAIEHARKISSKITP
jgi:predicted transcriptional regulator